MQGVAVVRFTAELSHWEPETFVRTVLVEWLHVAEVWVGANFLFGHDRAGNFSVLRSLGARYGFRAEKIDPVRYKDFVVSSTRIRRLVAEGRVDEAGALLGHHYFIDGDGRRAAPAAAASSGFRPRTCRPRTSCCRRPASMPRTVTIDGIVHAVGHQHRDAADLRRRRAPGDRDAHLRLSTAISTIDGCGCRSCSGCATSARFPDVDALRAQIDADCRSARRLFGRISL